IPLSAIALTDDGGVPGSTAIHPTYVTGDKNGNNILDKGEVWLYSYTATAQPGFNGNLATVSAIVSGKTYAGNDPAFYYGIQDQLTIFKAIDAVDPLHPTTIEEGDTTAQEQYVKIGDPLTFTYRVINAGNSPISLGPISDTVSGVVPTFVFRAG